MKHVVIFLLELLIKRAEKQKVKFETECIPVSYAYGHMIDNFKSTVTFLKCWGNG
jgi:hypothetical protein